MKKNNFKVLIISENLPPQVGGSPIVIDNLFSSLQADIFGITLEGGSYIDKEFIASFPIYKIDFSKLPLIGKFVTKYIQYFVHYLRPFFVWWIDKKVKKIKPDAIYSNCPYIDFFIIAHLIAKKNKIPFFAHMHDLWEENHGENTYTGRMAKIWEKEILTTATKVLCMTDVQRDFYNMKYGIVCDVIEHCIKDRDLDNLKFEYNIVENANLIFTGALSPIMNKDSMEVLARSMKYFKNSEKIIICTSTKKHELEDLGFDLNMTEVLWLSREQTQFLQRSSFVLFAPLSHKNCGMDEVRTVFSTKLLEYLISGRPIVIFAPKDSHHAMHARKHGWAYVVDIDDEKVLAKAFDTLYRDQVLCKNLVSNAYKEAKRRRASVQADKLYKIFRAPI